MQGGSLYNKSFTHPLLRCLSQEESSHMLKGIHDGCCGSHMRTWTLTNKALQAGYFWPTIKQDAQWLVNKCVKCQKHATLIHQSAEPFSVMLSLCPSSQWGIDIVGPFPLATGQRKFLLVVIDYFTKWIEAEPLTRITKGEVMKFVWKNIICCFGLPWKIISDNEQSRNEGYKTGVRGCISSKNSPRSPIPRLTGKSEATGSKN
ncbi:UNVERIFIED_CONTAM: Gag-Pol polyprotein [Sesamum calycinum]|uniref:Gag-Pol polyprotein n=1 Tax=Sesamum calycinum TaxID=2727403 RepID=A0AAW2J9Z6_9LAMI